MIFYSIGPNKAYGTQQDLGTRYRPLYPLEIFLSEALGLNQLRNNRIKLTDSLKTGILV